MRLVHALGIVLAGGAAIALIVSAAAPADKESPGDASSSGSAGAASEAQIPPEFQVHVTPEMRRHSRVRDILYFVGTFWSLGALALTLWTGLSRRIRDVCARMRWPFLSAMGYYAILLVVLTAIAFPLRVYSGFVIPHEFDLTDRTLLSWLGDEGKSLALGIAFGSPLAALALFGIGRMKKRWWLALWAGGVPISILLVVVAPIVIDPVFNDFVHLEKHSLEAKLLDLASRAGIEGGRVWQVDKSRQTRTMNAYVTGLGPTKRIVIWDTLLAKMTDDEILFVMGHEMGHYVLHHVWKGLAFGAALMFGVLLVGHRVVEWGVIRFGEAWGARSAADPAAIPWLLLVLSIFGFLLSPVYSGFSRRIEHEADVFTLELTRLNEAGARAFIKFAEDSKVDPSPSELMELWRYSHPPLSKRIAFVLSYRPWEEGHPNEVWHAPPE